MRRTLTGLALPDGALVVVACSGGADSLALAAATAFVAPRLGLRAGAFVVDHGLQPGSDTVAAQAAAKVRELGLDPVEVTRAQVRPAGGGPEEAARAARYAALEAAAALHTASVVLLGHTLAELGNPQVFLKVGPVHSERAASPCYDLAGQFSTDRADLSLQAAHPRLPGI